MKVYGPPTSVYVSFQNNGTEVIGFNQGIWQNNTWQQLNFDLTPAQSGGTSLDRVVFFFDQGLVNWDTYYIDDVGLSAAPVSTDNMDLNLGFDVYPNPLTNSSTVNFNIVNNSFVNIEIVDVKGKIISTLVNKYLEPNSYSVDMSSDLPNGIYLLKASVNESVITKKFIVNN